MFSLNYNIINTSYNFNSLNYITNLNPTNINNINNLSIDNINISSLINNNSTVSFIPLFNNLNSISVNPFSMGYPINNNQLLNNLTILLLTLLIVILSQSNNQPNSHFNNFSNPGIMPGMGFPSLGFPSVGSPSLGFPNPYIGSPNSTLPIFPDNSLNNQYGMGFSGGNIVNLALQQVGKPYIFGATGPHAFDCSGLVYWAYKQTGRTIPRTAHAQFQAGTPVHPSQMQPGDLVFFANTYKPGISHVGIYIGNGKFVHAANSQKGVIVSSLSESYYSQRFAGARRI